MAFQKKEKRVDIVFCIDATNSMGPCIDNVRKHSKQFYSDFVEKLKTEYDSDVTNLRVQVVTFRDLECDVDAIQKSEFFELPADTYRFSSYLDRITPRGGGDFKESGIEGLYTAMTTDWVAKSDSDRQVIILFTDADAIDFDEKRERDGYPNMVDETKFISTWKCTLGNANVLSPRAERLVMFAPPNSVYFKKLNKIMQRTQFCPVAPQKGMADLDFDTIMKLLCASVSSI